MFFLSRIIIAIILVAIFQSTALSSDRIVRLATLNWEPYAGEKLENYGFTSEIVAEAFKKADFQVEIYFMPWSRVLAEVKTGEYDAMYPAYYSKERSETYALSKPITQGTLAICKRSDEDIQYTGLSDLKNFKIGVVRGYVNTRKFDSSDYLKKELVNNDKQNLLKLLTGRIDLAVIDKYTAKQIMKAYIPLAVGKLNFLDPPLEVKPLHVGFSKAQKDYPELLKNFNRALNTMIEKGLVDDIIKKHGF